MHVWNFSVTFHRQLENSQLWRAATEPQLCREVNLFMLSLHWQSSSVLWFSLPGCLCLWYTLWLFMEWVLLAVICGLQGHPQYFSAVTLMSVLPLVSEKLLLGTVTARYDAEPQLLQRCWTHRAWLQCWKDKRREVHGRGWSLRKEAFPLAECLRLCKCLYHTLLIALVTEGIFSLPFLVVL